MVHEFYSQENDIFTTFENDGDGKKHRKKKVENEENKHLSSYPPIPPSYMEIDCFSVSEGTKKKDRPSLVGMGNYAEEQKKHRVERGVEDLCGKQK